MCLSFVEATNQHTHKLDRIETFSSQLQHLASMAPPSSDLRKIGLEGFALIDKFYGPTRRSSMEDLAYGATKDGTVHFVGISNVSYPKGKLPQNRWGRPFKF